MANVANMIQTSIFAKEEAEFRKFLESEGFSGFQLFPDLNEMYLNIYFDNPATIMNYTLRGVEDEYKVQRANEYYYDLDQDWDDEAEEFFGNDDEYH